PDRAIGEEKASTRQIGKGMKNIALQHHIPVFQPFKINSDEGLTILRDLRPDLFVVAAYGQILSPEVLAIPTLGGINVHASLLPKYRGAAPVQWTIANCEKETGVSIIQMTPTLDGGHILATVTTPVSPEETAGELEARLSTMGATIALEVIAKMEAGPIQGLPQDISLATKAPKLRKEHGNINWERNALEISAHIRAMQPWPTAFTLWKRNGQPPLRIMIFKAVPSFESTTTLPPGTILEPAKDLNIMQVAAGNGTILNVLEVQPAGKRKMAAAEFLRGRHWFSGDSFARA
ncbi:MAG: methionyl-tRNA formyltransferase, partial [Planctomycetes bacterium]|nr:methionyl-tRNA formyltransferase [Planctomycetota bacterium]